MRERTHHAHPHVHAHHQFLPPSRAGGPPGLRFWGLSLLNAGKEHPRWPWSRRLRASNGPTFAIVSERRKTKVRSLVTERTRGATSPRAGSSRTGRISRSGGSVLGRCDYGGIRTERLRRIKIHRWAGPAGTPINPAQPLSAHVRVIAGLRKQRSLQALVVIALPLLGRRQSSFCLRPRKDAVLHLGTLIHTRCVPLMTSPLCAGLRAN